MLVLEHLLSESRQKWPEPERPLRAQLQSQKPEELERQLREKLPEKEMELREVLLENRKPLAEQLWPEMRQ